MILYVFKFKDILSYLKQPFHGSIACDRPTQSGGDELFSDNFEVKIISTTFNDCIFIQIHQCFV